MLLARQDLISLFYKELLLLSLVRIIPQLLFELNIKHKCIAGETQPRIAYVEEITKHRQKLPLYDLEPRSENAWIAPNATIGKLSSISTNAFIFVYSW